MKNSPWWVVLRVLIAGGIVAVITVAILSAPPTFGGRPSHAGGTIWGTAFAAVGTLGAVWAALQAVRDSNAETRRIQREAQANEVRIRAEAQQREDEIRRGFEEREERVRHDNVRPVLTMASAGWTPWPQGGGHIIVTVRHDGGQSGLQSQMVVFVGDEIVSLSSSWGNTLIPDTLATLRGETDVVGTTTFVLPHPFDGGSEILKQGTPCVVALYFMDTLRWWWRQETMPFAPSTNGGHDLDGRYWFKIAFGMPERVDGPPHGSVEVS